MARKPNGPNIFRLGRRNTEKPRFDAVEILETYWQSLHDGRTLPRRAQIDPRDLGSVLEYAFILERIAPGVGRFRLAGNHLTELMGLEVRGMPATAIFLPEARREIAQVFEKTCQQPAISVLDVAAAAGLGRAALRGQMLLTPLLDEAGHVSRVLGCVQASGSIGRQPRRFSITGVRVRRLEMPTALPQSQPHNGDACTGFGETAGFAKTAPEFDATKTPDNQSKQGKPAPALHLVVNNG